MLPATSQWPRSNCPIPTAVVKPHQSNCHNCPVQTTMFKPSHPDHHVSPAAIHCHVPTTTSLLVALPALLLRCPSTESWTLHPATLGMSTIPPPHGHQVDIAYSLPVPHSSQPWLSHPAERRRVYCGGARWHVLRGERRTIFLLLTPAGQFMVLSDLHHRTEHRGHCRSLQ